MTITVQKLSQHLAALRQRGFGNCPVMLQDSTGKIIPLAAGDIGLLNDGKKYLIMMPNHTGVMERVDGKGVILQ